MVFPISGIAYLSSFFPIGFLTYRFFQYWQREKTVVSRNFLLGTLPFSISLLTISVSLLFFSENAILLKNLVPISTFFETIGLSFFGYLVIYTLLPRISPSIGFTFPFILGVTAVISSIFTRFNVYINSRGIIDWGYRPISDLIMGANYLLIFLPLAACLFIQYRRTETPYAKKRALGLGALGIFVFFFALFTYLPETYFSLSVPVKEIAQIVFSIYLFIFLLMSQKLPVSQIGSKIVP